MSIRCAIVDHPIDVAALLAEVTAPSTGATTLFLGTVRDTNAGRAVSGIEYSAYDAMAELELERIATEVQRKFSDLRIAIEHRVGLLQLQDVSVAIAVAHARRAPAIEASQIIIEELKRRVPVWKRELYLDGTREWTNPTVASAGFPSHG